MKPGARLTYRARKRLALLVLVVALPAWIVAAVSLVALLDRPPLWAEFLVYLGLGVLWALPLRPLFRGIAQPDPDAAPPDGKGGRG